MQSQNQGLDFNGKDIYAGIDAHLKSWRGVSHDKWNNVQDIFTECQSR